MTEVRVTIHKNLIEGFALVAERLGGTLHNLERISVDQVKLSYAFQDEEQGQAFFLQCTTLPHQPGPEANGQWPLGKELV